MNRFLIAAVLTLVTSLGLMAQKKVSKGEYDAYVAMHQATDADSRIAAAEAFVAKYADSQFKAEAFYMIAISYETKGDNAKAMAYADQSVTANPKFYTALLFMAKSTVAKTREFDLDKEQKLSQAEKYAKDAIELAQAAPKPNPNVTDAQWDAAKKDFVAEGHTALGMAATVRKKYDIAVKEYQTSIELASVPDAATMVRLTQAYNLSGKYDEATALANKIIAMPDVNPTIRSFAQAERARAAQGKAAAAKPADPKPAETKQP
jgi:tetratricopeptide (TPR) repeat protein